MSGLGLAAGLAVGGIGCARSSTLVNVLVSADDSVPVVSVLRVTLQQAGAAPASNLFRSLLADTDGGVQPFQFPAPVEFNFPAGFAAPASVTVEALADQPDYPVLAAGAASVDIRPQASVVVEVTLTTTAVAPPPVTAGADGGDVVDGGAPPEASD